MRSIRARSCLPRAWAYHLRILCPVHWERTCSIGTVHTPVTRWLLFSLGLLVPCMLFLLGSVHGGSGLSPPRWRMRVGRGGTAVWLGAVRAREAERAWRRKCLCPYRCLAIDRDAYGALAHAVPGDLIAHRRGGMDSRDRGIIGEDRVVAGWPAEWPMDPSSVRCSWPPL